MSSEWGDKDLVLVLGVAGICCSTFTLLTAGTPDKDTTTCFLAFYNKEKKQTLKMNKNNIIAHIGTDYFVML